MRIGWRVLSFPTIRIAAASDGFVDRVLGEAAAEIERRAKQRVPVDTGRLKSSIRHARVEKGVWSVTAGTNYAKFVEFGTGVRGRATNTLDTPPDYQHGPSLGQAAQPYLRPSAAEVMTRVKTILKQSSRLP